MKLHGNAALSWRGRRRLVGRVVVEGWTLTAAAEAAGVSVRCARKWVGRYRREGEQGLLDRLRRPGGSRTARAGAGRGDREAAAVAFTAAEIAETLGDAALDGLGDPDAVGMGGSGRLGLEQPVRYERSRPGELVHVDVKKLGRIQAAPAGAISGGCTSTTSRPTPTDAASARQRRLGVRPRRRRRLQPARLRRGPRPTRRRRPRSASSAAPSPSITATASGRAAAHRQRLRLPRHHPRARLQEHSASDTSAPGPTGRRQTAKQNASSAPCSTAGPTAPSTARAANAPTPLTAGSGTTTIDADTQPSATNPRSAEPTC